MTKTPQEIADLKAGWRRDPIWDIEDTEGFEEYKTELLQYRLDTEREWVETENARIEKKATELQCSADLVKYIELLEYKIEKIGAK